LNKRLLNVGLIVLIDMLGFAIIIPLLTFYADSFGATEFQTGLLVSSYALMQMISAPILGRLSDRYGRRPVFLISIFVTLIGLLILGFGCSSSAAFFQDSPLGIFLWRKPTSPM
jgi:DHA1 family tetracycline resistance protein-like MFS transporter